MSHVEHARAAEAFLAAERHVALHDERLWGMRAKRDLAAAAVPEWEDLRARASRIKRHTLTHLADYLTAFEANATARGIHVHWARDAAEHNRVVHEILETRGVRRLVKSKSMLQEECGLTPYLEARGIEVTETDLGERIQQLDDEPPSHIVAPAVHKTAGDVARVFADRLATVPEGDDATDLAEAMRQDTRPRFLAADAGMTGVNFAVAETGGFVVCTNEGNADLGASLPPLHVASMGIEKLVPRVADLAVFVRLLSRSALGSPITQYTSHFQGPRPGGEIHVVVVDNGRSARLAMPDFWTGLQCIRCGACLNTCPVYRRSGGLSYGATDSGPIGAILDPALDLGRYRELPFASTLCGSCSAVCPVKIDIHGQLYAWRRVVAARGLLSLRKRAALRLLGWVLADPRRFRVAVRLARVATQLTPGVVSSPRLNPWARHRAVPTLPRQAFRDWYRANRSGP